MKPRTTFTPRLEPLDTRAMPSATLANGVLAVGGTAGTDLIRVTQPAAGLIQVANVATGEVRRFSLSQVERLWVNSGDGNDRIVVGAGVTLPAALGGGAGDDLIVCGSGDDRADGGGGNDAIRGRGGNDDLRGGVGNDDLRGGGGDDRLDGGRGRDGCHGDGGDDDIRSGFDLDTELIAVFTGGQGDAEFKFGPEDGSIEREFEVEVEDLPAGVTLGVFVDGVNVGAMRTNSFGDARLEYELDFDRDNDGAVDFPPGFPEIHVGSVVQVRLNGSVVRQGTFA